MADADEPRFLHRSLGYTRNPGAALHGEPEAVSADAQAELTWRAQRDARDELEHEWTKARSRILGAVDHFEQTARPPGRLQRDVRSSAAASPPSTATSTPEPPRGACGPPTAPCFTGGGRGRGETPEGPRRARASPQSPNHS
jgi:hypothetical protein